MLRHPFSLNEKSFSSNWVWLAPILHIDKRGYIPYNKKGEINLQKFKVDYYKKEDGSCPVREFLDSLDKKMRAKLLRTIMLLEENGSELRAPHSKALEDGIFELRAQQGSDISRMLYFFIIGHKIIITNGFVKKTQKTPQSEMNLAKKYRTEYLKREGKQYE